MNISTRRAAAVVLAVALSVPAFGRAARDDSSERQFEIPQRIFAIAKKVQKLFFRITPNSEVPMPPKP